MGEPHGLQIPLMQAQDRRSPFDWNILKTTGFNIQQVAGYRLQLRRRTYTARVPSPQSSFPIHILYSLPAFREDAELSSDHSSKDFMGKGQFDVGFASFSAVGES